MSIYFDLLLRIGPTRMSMVTYILPLLAVLLGIIFLDERFHWGAIIGALLILSGITIVNVRPGPQALILPGKCCCQAPVAWRFLISSRMDI